MTIPEPVDAALPLLLVIYPDHTRAEMGDDHSPIIAASGCKPRHCNKLRMNVRRIDTRIPEKPPNRDTRITPQVPLYLPRDLSTNYVTIYKIYNN